MSDTEFTVLGAGAIGSILAAHLARAGHTVVLLARNRRADQLERDGLRIRGLSEFDTPIRVLRDPSELRSTNVLIVATKTPGTEQALQALRHVRLDSCFSIQNGTLKNELLGHVFGTERVLGALANTSGELQSNGDVLFTRNVNVLLGELTAGASDRAVRIATTIDRSGVRSKAVDDIVSLEWSKFCAWVSWLTLSVTTRSPTWQFLRDPDAARLALRLIREMVNLADALHVTITDQSVVPVATLMSTSEDEAIRALNALGERYRIDAPLHRMSSLQDLDAGRPLEVHETLGYAVKKARELNVPSPLLEAMYWLVAAIDPARAPKN